MLRRLWNVMMGWLGLGIDKLENPEVILERAQQEMQEQLRKVKEQAVAALTQKNMLVSMLKEKKEQLGQIDARVKAAITQGADSLAEQLLVERNTLADSITQLEAQVAQAEKTSESIKQSVSSYEAQIRQKAAEKLQLVTSWKQAQIQESINRAMSQVLPEGHTQDFERAKEKINQAQARAMATAELGETNLQQQIAKLDVDAKRQQAKEQLEALKQQYLGNGSVGQFIETEKQS